MNAICHFESHPELVLLHFKDVIFVHYFIVLRYARRILEKDCRGSTRERTLAQKYWLLGGVGVFGNIVVSFTLMSYQLSLKSCA